ncbi:uncharacterized protein LOC112033060 [Quercus suber]|uniref:uncharacterized protein LOC112033060 n=1 Tax=Quercus suber TaxID=58331 RepID=UPI000CE1BC3C|nr:uncharacterized protein LOC112033060 [Quercus suber]
MGIQRRSQRGLKDVIEGQPGRVVEKQVQTNPPPLPPLHPQSPQPTVTEPSDPKRRREPKGKEVMDAGRPHTTREDEDQRAAKQQKTSHGSQRGVDKTTTQSSEPGIWLPAPMLDEKPLREDASIRDFSDGLGCRVASALEETLLLPRDIAELRAIKRNEVFQNTKRYLGMAIQATFRLEEIVESCHQQIDEERKKRIAAVRILNASEQNIVQLKKRLTTEESARKSADSALKGFQRQKQLEEVQKLRDQAEKAKAEAEKERDVAEQRGYDVGVAETEDTFQAELGKPENVYLPPAIRASTPSTPQGEASSTAVEPPKEVQTQAPPSLNQQEQPQMPEKAKDLSSAKEVEGPKNGATSPTFEQALASTTLPVGEAPKAQEKDVPPEAAGKAPPPKLQIKLTK